MVSTDRRPVDSILRDTYSAFMSSHPNVLLLVTDDQGAWALGSRMPELHTPTLDRLQREGATFDSFFCASPVCSPARASIMTGRMPSAHGVHDWIRPEALARTASRERPHSPELLDVTDADTIAAMLSRDNYRCGMVGKWHVGSSDRAAEGFDYWYAHQLGGGPYYGAPIWRQDGTTGLPADNAEPASEPEYLTDAITRRGLDFLDRHHLADDNRPFFLQVNWTAPHDPWFDDNHPSELTDLYTETDFPSVPQPELHHWFRREHFQRATADRRGALTGYSAAISGVDRSVETLLHRLDERNELHNTIVIFTSDNGFSCGHHGIWGKGNATWPLNFWEPSIKVPFIVRWPDRVQAGHIDTEQASATSILETIAELTGTTPREDPLRAGRSLAPRLLGTTAAESDPAPVVIYDEYGANRMIRTDRWKLIVRREGPMELYDLHEDPEEAHNLATDPRQTQKLQDLTLALTDWFTHHETATRSGWRTDIDGLGQERPVL